MDDRRDLWWQSITAEFGKVLHLDLAEPLNFVYGGSLSDLQISYETWGTLNEERDNAVLIVHPLAFDCHVTGAFAEQPLGWLSWPVPKRAKWFTSEREVDGCRLPWRC